MKRIICNYLFLSIGYQEVFKVTSFMADIYMEPGKWAWLMGDDPLSDVNKSHTQILILRKNDLTYPVKKIRFS